MEITLDIPEEAFKARYPVINSSPLILLTRTGLLDLSDRVMARALVLVGE